MKRLWLFLFPLSLFAKISYISVGGGVFDVLRSKYRTGEVKLEYQTAASWCWIHPIAGVLQNFKGSTYFYGGFAINIGLEKFLVIPSLAAGYYHHGGGKDLGYPLEFRSAVMICYQRPSKMRIGIQFAHVSNAGLSHRNPGEESLSLVFGFPLKWPEAEKDKK